MTNPDLVTWTNTTASILTTELPLQSLDSAVNFAFAYISNVGGWVPDNSLDPNGPGEPADHATEQEAAATITSQQIGNVYDLNFTVQVTLNVQFSAQLGSGLDIDAAAAAMAASVENFVTDAINDSDIPVRVDTVDSQSPVSGASLIGGNTTQPLRVAIFAEVTGDDKIVDYKAIALDFGRTINGLDDTWNVKFVYTQESSPIVVMIAKYTNDTWTTLDSAETTVYVYSMSPTTYQIVSGVVINP